MGENGAREVHACCVKFTREDVEQAFLPAGIGDFPVSSFSKHKHGARKLREPAGWKACPTLVMANSRVWVFGCCCARGRAHSDGANFDLG